jgi:hypothetical protein
VRVSGGVVMGLCESRRQRIRGCNGDAEESDAHKSEREAAPALGPSRRLPSAGKQHDGADCDGKLEDRAQHVGEPDGLLDGTRPR